MDKLLTVKEAAERLRIAAGSLYHWVSEGRVPCVRFSARCLRFRESDLSKLIEELVRGPAYKFAPDDAQHRGASKRR